MLYLVTGDIRVNQYMSPNCRLSRTTRLVEADSAKEAEEKFRRHYESLSQPYRLAYSVDDITVDGGDDDGGIIS